MKKESLPAQAAGLSASSCSGFFVLLQDLQGYKNPCHALDRIYITSKPFRPHNNC